MTTVEDLVDEATRVNLVKSTLLSTPKVRHVGKVGSDYLFVVSWPPVGVESTYIVNEFLGRKKLVQLNKGAHGAVANWLKDNGRIY